MYYGNKYAYPIKQEKNITAKELQYVKAVYILQLNYVAKYIMNHGST